MSITVETVGPRTVALVRSTATMAEMPEAMARGLARVMRALAERGIEPAGPPMTVYAEPVAAEEPLVFETAVPVPPGTVGDADVSIVEMPTAHVAVYMHEGSYSELGNAYQHALAEVHRAGLLPGGAPREIYLNDPGATPPDRLLTRLEFPVFEPD